jgi:hypothetical protein
MLQPFSTQYTVTGSAVQLSSNPIQNQVTFYALSGNTGTTYIGTSSSTSSSNGFPLEKGTSVTIRLSNGNTNMFYVIGTASDKIGIAGS